MTTVEMTPASKTPARKRARTADEQVSLVRAAAAGGTAEGLALASLPRLALPEHRTANDVPTVLAAVRQATEDVQAHIDADALALADCTELPAELVTAHANTAAAISTLSECVRAIARVLA